MAFEPERELDLAQYRASGVAKPAAYSAIADDPADRHTCGFSQQPVETGVIARGHDDGVESHLFADLLGSKRVIGIGNQHDRALLFWQLVCGR